MIDKSVKEIRVIENREESLAELVEPYGAETLRKTLGEGDHELTPSQVVQGLCHLDPKVMADAIAALNRQDDTATISLMTGTKSGRFSCTEPNKSNTPKEAIKVGGLPPCAECGSSNFLRTGTCHVCAQCGSSQGCS